MSKELGGLNMSVKLNENHPVEQKYKAEWDAVNDAYLEAVSIEEEKFGEITQANAHTFTKNIAPLRKKRNAELNALRAKYSYLYEEVTK